MLIALLRLLNNYAHYRLLLKVLSLFEVAALIDFSGDVYKLLYYLLTYLNVRHSGEFLRKIYFRKNLPERRTFK